MPTFTFSLPDFLPFTKIVSADMNTTRNDIKTFFNTTKLDSTNIQDGGVTRSTKLSAGTANAVVINDGTGKMTDEATLARSRGGLQFAPSLTGAGGQAIVVNDAETSFALGAPSQASLTENLSTDVSSLTCGEAITINDAVCLDIAKDASNSNIYRVFRCDSDLANRRFNFLGIALTTGTVVAGNYTWTGSAALVTSNTIAFTVNSRSYSQAFTTDNDTTLAAIAAKLAADPEIQSASVVDSGSNDRVINVVGKGGLFLNISGTVTGGASQATITITIPQAPSGSAVRVRTFGTVTTFSGLTTGLIYYLSGTTGAITATPSDTAPIQVGQALSSTVLFVCNNFKVFQFSTPTIFVRLKGSSDYAVANGVATGEHFNLVSWTAATSDASARTCMQAGNGAFNGLLYMIDGIDTAGTLAVTSRSYNKVAYAAQTNRATARIDGGITNLSNVMYVSAGTTSNTGAFGSGVQTIDSFNGSAWTAGAATLNAGGCGKATFIQGGLLHYVGGTGTAGSGVNNHDTYNGASISTATVVPTSSSYRACGESAAGGMAGGVDGATGSYAWTGSWSSSITIPYICNSLSGRSGTAASFVGSGNKLFINGGRDNSGTTTHNDTASFNGTSWNAETASVSALQGSQGGGF